MVDILSLLQKHHSKEFPAHLNTKKIRKDGNCGCQPLGTIEISDDFPWCKYCSPAYVTIFREPLSRLYSAYRYCFEVDPSDPLCAYNHPITDVCSFAKMWGSYQFDKLLTIPYDVEDTEIHEYASRWCPTCSVFNRERHRIRFSSKESPYRSVIYTNKLMLSHYGLNDLSTKQGRIHLKRVIRSLNQSFSVIGIMEKWPQTMALLHAYTGCSDFTVLSSIHRNAGNRIELPGKKVLSTGRTLDTNSTNRDWNLCLPAILKYLDADIQIYDAAVAIFYQQLRAYSANEALVQAVLAAGRGQLQHKATDRTGQSESI
jgi:hypothetical protein